MLKKNNLYLLGLATLIGFPLLGFGINYLIESDSKLDILQFRKTDFYNIPVGLIIGISIAMIAERVSEIPFISKSAYDLTEFFRGLKLNFFDVFFLSFAAGFGEEIFFRGIIQDHLGIWVTSIIFIAIHGYLNIKNPGMFVFGLFLILFSNLLGLLHSIYGIWPAIAAHFSYDLILLASLKKPN